MMDVLPTDWSPKKTNLYLARGAKDVLLLGVPRFGALLVGAAADALSLIVTVLVVGNTDDQLL